MVLIRGIELELHPIGEALSDHIRREQDFFEADILDYLVTNFPVQKNILDIGANIGNHAVFMATFFQEYDGIWAYEPVPDNFELLKRNVERFQSVYPFNFALSDRTGVVYISPKRDNMGASEIHPEGSLIALCVKLDDLMFPYQTNITLIKLDVEWHEPQVLAGAEKIIQRDKPLILIEDSNKEYAKLLPDYECIMAWEGERTYLYQWRR